MDSVEECNLKAENYASAAMLVPPEEARVLMRLAQIWRNRALRRKLGPHRETYLKAPQPSDPVWH
jgi:hypothetical protein